MRRKLRGIVAGALVALTWASVAAADVERAACESLSREVPRIVCVDADHALAAQPAEAAYGAIARAGFHAVLNLRTAEEAAPLAAEEKSVRDAGMRYLWLPVKSDAPTDEDAQRFLSLLRAPDDLPVLVHCGTGNRAAAFWMIHRVVDEGWSLEDALAEAESFGLENPRTREFAERFAREHAGDPNPSEEKKR